MAQFESLIVTGLKGKQIINSAWAEDKWHIVGGSGEPAFTGSPLWLNYSVDFPPAGFRKDSEGYVRVRGLVKTGVGTIFTLPLGYRPSYVGGNLSFSTSSNGTYTRLIVSTDGSITFATVAGSNVWVSLESIYFLAEG